MRSSSLDDMSIENDNCCFCYYDALKKQLPLVSKSTDDLDQIYINDEKKSHIKVVMANFYSDVILQSLRGVQF